MDWLDYREKLGIGFSDTQKFEFFRRKIFSVLESIKDQSDFIEYFSFCNTTGSTMTPRLAADNVYSNERYTHIIKILKDNSQIFLDLISYYMAFINAKKDTEDPEWGKTEYKNLLCNMLNESHIPFDVIEDKDGYFIFPKGAKELDDALISQPLEWLSAYPASHKAFIKALKDYSDATEETASNVADNFRKALECFCQEFFGGSSGGLEKYRSVVGSFLKSKGVPAEISGNFESILRSYCSYINSYAKHRDATSDKVLEFIMYQTGSFIRLILTFDQDKKKIIDI